MQENQIIEKQILTDSSVRFRIFNPLVSKKSFAGNFLIVVAREGSERIPLTIMDYDENTVSIVVKPIGFSTREICDFEKGEKFNGILGPLGNRIKPIYGKTLLFIGGGVGIAPIIPQMKEYRNMDNRIILVHGARDRDSIILEDICKDLSHEYIVCTDDGSLGNKGLVTDAATPVLEKGGIDHVITVGPLIMMKFVSMLTKQFDIPTTASLNSIMVDGTGMCGSCRVEYDGEVKFACVDGPDMDAHRIDFDTLLRRNSRFRKQEEE